MAETTTSPVRPDDASRAVPGGPARPAPEQQGPPGEPRRVAYLYLAPALLVFSLFLLFPLLHAVYLSFFEWDGLSVGTWVGVQNYVDVVTDPDLRAPFWHAAVLVVFFSAVPVSLGVVFASLMTRSTVRGAGFYRTVIFLPQVVALTVVAVAWRDIYAPSGPLNDLLGLVGLDSFARGWLGDASWVLVAVGIVGVWVGTGLCTVLMLAGLAGVGRDVYEASRLDGAGFWRELFSISLPALRNELAVAITLTMVAALRTFDLVYVMTSGGPARASVVPSYEVYDRAMQKGEVGTGVTIALILTAVILLATVLVNRLSEERDA